MSASGERRFAIITAILGLLIAGMIAWQWLLPAHSGEVRAETERQATVSQIGSLEHEATSLRKQIAAGEAKLTPSVLVALPPQIRWEREFNRLSILAKTVGASISSFTPSSSATPSSEGSGAQDVGASITVTCNYGSCLRFLGGLRELVHVKHHGHISSKGPIWYVNSVNLSPAGEGSLSMALNGGVYLSPTPIEGARE